MTTAFKLDAKYLSFLKTEEGQTNGFVTVVSYDGKKLAMDMSDGITLTVNATLGKEVPTGSKIIFSSTGEVVDIVIKDIGKETMAMGKTGSNKKPTQIFY